MTYKAKFMEDHADMPKDEAEELMGATCPSCFGYKATYDCPVTDGLMNSCAECWGIEMEETNEQIQ